MTREEEALNRVEFERRWLSDAGYNAYNVDVAFNSIRTMIKILFADEQELCEDAISRQAAIDAIDALYLDGDSALSYRANAEGDTLIGKFQTITTIDDLPSPSVHPMRKFDDVNKIKELLDAIKSIAGNLEDVKDYENIKELCNDIEKVVTK